MLARSSGGEDLTLQRVDFWGLRKKKKKNPASAKAKAKVPPWELKKYDRDNLGVAMEVKHRKKPARLESL
jgi:hypothetical protein